MGKAQNLAGKSGGRVVVAIGSEPKTLNPVTAADQPTRDAIYALSADLIHINRATLLTEPALAENWRVSADGRHYTLTLRKGLRFSDGAPLTADDVVFTFQVYLDSKTDSPQRDLLMIDGKPIQVIKLSAESIRVDLPAPYAPGERLFDSFWILPRHKLQKAFDEGRLAQAWSTAASAADLATAGPFRLKEYKPGQRLTLERNPYYWKKDSAGHSLPYLDQLEFTFGDQNAQVLRLLGGEVDAVAKIRAEDFANLEKNPSLSAVDGGPSLESNFIFFNWNAPQPLSGWFRNLKFRQAVAYAIDRQAIARLVYQGRGSPLWTPAAGAIRLWFTDKVTRYPYDLKKADQLLRDGGFRRQGTGPLLDSAGRPVRFSIMVSASNQLRRRMAALVQEDLSKAGIEVQVLPTEFGAMMDAVNNTRKFEGALFGLGNGDADPNTEMNVWTSGGSLHVWNLKKDGAAPEAWQTELDRLMDAQMTATSQSKRKAVYDRVQQLLSENLPVTFLASPNVLAAAKRGLANWKPAVLEPVLVWNCDRFFWQTR